MGKVSGLRLRGKTWQLRWYRDGRRYEESLPGVSETEAKKTLNIRKGDSAKGLPITPKIGRLRFEEAVVAVVNDYKSNKRRSLVELERRIRLHLTPYFGG